jgi:hypothetical protein
MQSVSSCETQPCRVLNKLTKFEKVLYETYGTEDHPKQVISFLQTVKTSWHMRNFVRFIPDGAFSN